MFQTVTLTFSFFKSVAFINTIKNNIYNMINTYVVYKLVVTVGGHLWIMIILLQNDQAILLASPTS